MLAENLEGLTSTEAKVRLGHYGPNAVAEERAHPLKTFALKFWGPIPWMLEASILLEVILGKQLDAVITFALLSLNAVLSYTQENRAQIALGLLRTRLTIQARTRRDGSWQLLPAQMLVPGDVVHVRVGDMVPADVELVEGHLAVDQSALTGESAAVDLAPKNTAYAGTIVKRGEATSVVTATGRRIFYGKTAELVQLAKTRSHLEDMVQDVVKYLMIVNALLAATLLAYTFLQQLPLSDMLPFTLILLVASIPIALPATFTLASALGSVELSKYGVLVTRLSAVKEAAEMNVLCSDKTGTITINRLELVSTQSFSPYSEQELLAFAALSSDEATQDPIDLAILRGAKKRGVSFDLTQRVHLTPFDPQTKRTEAIVKRDGRDTRIVKGFPSTIAALTNGNIDIRRPLEELAAAGDRVIAVAAGQTDNSKLELIGLIGLQDPPRPESQAVIQKLRDLGVRVIMVTGDTLATAQVIAQQVGIRGTACSRETLQSEINRVGDECAVLAGVFPEDKFHVIQSMQKRGHVVGMTGDGVNDAPALKQAEVGIAVASAMDVAKAAASLVLTKPGLSDMPEAVRVGRQIYQRMLSYTLNKIVKTFQIGFFLTLGLMFTGILITRPRLILLLLFANDFVTMALATDNVSASPKPDRWNLRTIVIVALILAGGWLLFSFGVLGVGQTYLGLEMGALQTLIFLLLVFSGQANVYLVRERSHFWRSRPSTWLVASTGADVLIMSFLAAQGILMTPLASNLIAALLIATGCYMVALDFVKIFVFRRVAL